MEDNKNIFIKIDEFIFQKLDLLRADGSFQKINELITTLDENQQKIVAQVLTFSLILIPYMVVATLWWGNHFSKKRLEVKNQILEQISMLNGNKGSLMQVSSTYLAPTPIQSQEDLDNKIRNLMSSVNIDQKKISVHNFSQLSTSSAVAKVEASISFKEFGTQDFSSFMSTLVEKERFKITRISMTKNNTTSLLSGEISLIHLGKTANQ